VTYAEQRAEISRLGGSVCDSNPLLPQKAPAPAPAASERRMPSRADIFKAWSSSAKTKELLRSSAAVPYPIMTGARIQKIGSENISVEEEDGHVVFVVDESSGKDESGVAVPGCRYVVADELLRRLVKASEPLRDLIKKYVSDADAARFPGIAPAPAPQAASARAATPPSMSSGVPFGPALVQLRYADVLGNPSLRSRLIEQHKTRSFQIFATTPASEGYTEFVDMTLDDVRQLLNAQYLEQKAAHPDRVPRIGVSTKKV